MNRQAVALTDDQSAIVSQRGTSVTLSIMEAAYNDYEAGLRVPASSISVSGVEGVKALRDLLNRVDLGDPERREERASVLIEASNAGAWKTVKENALDRLGTMTSHAKYQVINALSAIVRNTVGIRSVNELSLNDQGKAQAIVDVIVDAMIELRLED
ncbi:hypothetical protein [Paenibacillus sp. FSL R7-0026]|uniref:hypothetical protein n=1 Tax=Paenibacillus sp. FSL R7-0026 TaxID=2921668 RepID=UPI0030F6C523